MALERQVIFWVVALAVFAGIVWLMSPVLLPFIAGMALAYLLDPLARAGERFGVGRAISALVVLTVVIVAIVVAVMAVAPIAADQFNAFMDSLPGYINKVRALLSDPSRPWLAKIFGGSDPDAEKSLSGLVSQGSGFIATFLASLWSGGRAVFQVLSLVVITPVVAFYLLCDWDRVVVTVDSWIPRQHRDTIHGLLHDMDAAIAGFVRGQALICLILAAFYAIGLTLVGLNSGFLIGLMTGLFSFIPFVGAATGFLVAAIVAVAQFWPDWMSMGLVIAVFVIGQGLEGYILSPNLVGAKVGLHPVWLMFSLLAFGYLLGFVGLLIAIPLAAAIGVLVRFSIRKYQESPLYTGQDPGHDPHQGLR
jgi:predicted PurR-regulated permease PerM